VNHPAIIRFCSFSAINFCGGCPSISYQPCTKPEPTAKYLWWNSKENNTFTLRKFVGALKQANKSTTNQLASNAIFGPSKRQKRGFAGMRLHLTLHRIRTQT
jgi:hypothetical protein